MSSLEKEISDLREQNHELVKAVQNWKMVAGEREKDILKLTKEANDLRIQLSILRTEGGTSAQKLEAGLQIKGETALSHLVQGSNAVAEMMELIKNHMIDREKIESSSRKNLVDSTPNMERVQRVPPLMMGGKYIQPVVSLSRATIPNNSLTESQRSNENHSGSVRPLPMRVLQEVYIPLTRIDADMTPPDDMENNHDTSVDVMGLEEDNDEIPEQEDGETTPRDDMREELTVVLEESEESGTTTIADPLEGPSRLLDSPNFNVPIDQSTREFTPTMRRRKRPSSPLAAEPSPILVPRHALPRHKTNGRILKVLVAKMRLDNNDVIAASPTKKQRSAAGYSEMNGSSPESWDRPGSSRDNYVSPNPSTSRNKAVSPWEKPDSPQDKTVPPWDRPGSSRDKHVSPWNVPGPSGGSSKKGGSSRNKSRSPLDKIQPRNALEESSSSSESDCMEDVPYQVSSKYRRQKRTASRDSKNSRERSPLRMSQDPPSKVVRDVQRQRPNESPRKSSIDIYRFSIDSQNTNERPVFDAPSPNGSTNTRVIVQETAPKNEVGTHRGSRTTKRNNSTEASSECSDEVPETRTRRARKPVTYKENLKGKLRR